MAPQVSMQTAENYAVRDWLEKETRKDSRSHLSPCLSVPARATLSIRNRCLAASLYSRSHRSLHKHEHKQGKIPDTRSAPFDNEDTVEVIAMKTLRLCGLTAISILLFSACTTEVKFAAIDIKKPIEGVVYHLPATEMSFTPTYQIDTCGRMPAIRIIAFEVGEDVVPDRQPSATYILNHKLLTDWLKMIESAKI